MRGIGKNHETLMCLLATNDISRLISIYYTELQINDVVVNLQPGRVDTLRVIATLISSHSIVRVIVMVDDTHMPTLRLLRAIGVSFIISKREPLNNIVSVLNNPMLTYYMSPGLQYVIEKSLPSSQWAKSLGTFNEAEPFTPTETDIILDLCHGISPWNVAKKRFISIKTVSRHKINALQKIGIKNLNEIFMKPRAEKITIYQGK